MMKGALLNTMRNEPYAARIYCEAEDPTESALIPEHVATQFAMASVMSF